MPVPNKDENSKEQEVPNVEEPSNTSESENQSSHTHSGHNLTVNDIIIIDPDTLELDLNHGRIGKLQNLEPLTQVERMYLRWNLITKIENLGTLTTLKELELYDNQVTKIEGLDALVNLEILDLSFNRIREIEGLENLENLEKLFLSSNKITKIQNLGHLKKLTLLELGDNKLREIENLDGLTELTTLYLGKNKFTEIKNLDSLVKLTCLSLQSNRITKIENLDKLTELNELYLSENAITKIENLKELTNLETLDLAQNQISAIENTETLVDLAEFWLNDNKISDWNTVNNLSIHKNLSTVYLERNPIAEDPMYRRKLTLIAPSLKQIDATLCQEWSSKLNSMTKVKPYWVVCFFIILLQCGFHWFSPAKGCHDSLIIASLDNIRLLAQYNSFSLIMHTDQRYTTMTDQQFVLKWHYHENTLIQNLPYLLDNNILSDVTISVGAQHIKAHKIILAMCSVYFLQLFQEMKNTQHPVVVLHNASIEDVRAMLAFMYRGQCVVSKDQLPNLLSVAKLLKIQGLCDMKVPEKDVSTETIPLEPPTDSKPVEAHTNLALGEFPCDTEISEKDKTYESGCSYIPSSISLKRHSSSSGYSTAINLSTDSKRIRLSPTWEKPLRETPENISPCSPEDTPPAYPTSSTKKLPSPKDTSETCKCFLCGKYLSNQYNLRVHMETHEEAYHACQSCPHVSRSRDALRKHVSYRHPEEYLTKKRKKTESS